MLSLGLKLMLCALLIVSVPAIAQDTPNPQASSAPAGFAAPGQVGRYKLSSSHDYGQASLGVAYQYALADGSADSSFATLYLYKREETERGWPVDSVLATSVAEFKEGLSVMRNRSDYESYQVASEGLGVATRAEAVVSGVKRGLPLLWIDLVATTQLRRACSSSDLRSSRIG